MSRIHLSPPDVGAAERELLLDAFDSNWIAPVGAHLDAFEAEVAALAGVGNATALISGTAALHLALLLLGVGPGDRVIVPTLTFVATANAVQYTGATPVFVDSDATSWCLDPALLATALDQAERAGRLPKAVITVDLYGQCADYHAIAAACSRYGIPIIEDAAEALGATYRGRPAGSFGSLGIFSFNGNKIVTTGGGGMLVSDDADLIDRARHLSTQARDAAPHYEHSVTGYNYRLSNLLAAVGRGQIQSFDAKLARRRVLNERYREALADLPGVGLLPEAPYGRSNQWLTVITIDPALSPATTHSVRTHLESLDIEARPAWKPMHLQPLFAGAECWGGNVSERIFATGLCLPSGSSLSDGEQELVIAEVVAALQHGATGHAEQ